MAEKTKSLEATPQKTPEASSSHRSLTPTVSPSQFSFAAVLGAAGNMSVQRAVRGTGGEDTTPFTGMALNLAKPKAASPARLQRACAAGCTCEKCDLQLAAATSGLTGTLAPDQVLSNLGPGAPFDPDLAAKLSPAFGADLTGVRVHPDSDVAPAIGARAFTVGHHVAFAPGEYNPNSDMGSRLLGHELAHVAQQSKGVTHSHPSGPPRASVEAWEHEAEAAGNAIASGGHVGRLTPFQTSSVQRSPAPPGTAEVPFSAAISKEFENPKSPDKLDVKVTLHAPGFGDVPSEKVTLVLHKPVLGATSVTAYQIRLADLYPSAEAAAEASQRPQKDREALSLRGSPLKALDKAAATIAARTSGKQTAASVDAPGTSTSPGQVVDAGPSATTTPELAFDITGTPVVLVARSADFGITTEYTKLAVGAASTTVLKTPTGFTLIDIGVRHDGDTKDPAAMKHCVDRLKEIIGNNPIEIMLTHTHLDHAGMLREISREFVINEITINSIQLIDFRFLEAAMEIGANQRRLLEGRLTKQFEAQRDTWEADPTLTRLIPEKGARDLAFKEWVKDQATLEVAKMKPIQVNVMTPGGSTIDAKSLGIGGIEIVPKEATAPAGPGEGFSFTEYARSTLADPRLREKYEALEAERATNPKAKMRAGLVDEMSSSYLMKLPNGNQLVVVPDIRVADIARIQRKLKAELVRLGAEVEFRLWDMTHHMQSGFVGTKKKAPTADPSGTASSTPAEPVVGTLRMSQLEKLSEMLSQLLTTPGKAGGATVDVVTVSVDPTKVDPALARFLRLCGLHVLTAEGERDLQFLEGKTAAGRKVAGFTEDPSGTQMPSDPLLRRTAIALETLREQLQAAEEELAKERTQKKAEAKTRKAELKTTRNQLASERETLRRARNAADKGVTNPSARQKTQDQATRNQTLTDAQAKLDAKIAEIEALDAQVKAIETQGERLAPEVARLKKQISGIEKARRSYFRRLEAFSRSSRDSKVSNQDAAAKAEALLQAEEIALDQAVRPVYGEALTAGKLPVLGETTLIIFKKGATTEAGLKLEAQRIEIEAVHERIANGDLSIRTQAEFVAKLQDHISELQARPDAADPTVVDEIEYLEKQVKNSQLEIEKSAKKGKEYLDRDPTTGMKTRSYVIRETGTEEAQEAEGKGSGVMQKGMHLFGRAMGGVMVYHEILAAGDLAERYGAGKATAGEFAFGVTKSAYGVNIGYRMLKGAHVNMAEFVILSVLEVASTALADYESTEAYNTEVTFALIRNAVNLACAAIGMALIETANPIGILAGLAIMFLGDAILDALGVHDWLAKKFDFRPDEYIDLEKDLLKLLDEYSVIVGARGFQARSDETLKALGATSPAGVRSAAGELLEQRRAALRGKEREIMNEFFAAYSRAKQGYSQLREIDDLRAQFLDLYLQAHKDDPSVKGPSTWLSKEPGPVTIAEVQQRFAGVEQVLAKDDITLEQVPKMEQWTNMDKWIGTLETFLYRTDPKEIEWMKVSEAERNIMMMVNNARYRLDPQLQSKHRVTPLFAADSPVRKEYERQLLERENKLDHLRRRTVKFAIGEALPVVASEGYTVCNRANNIATADVCEEIPPTYYGPSYGDLTAPPKFTTQLNVAVETVAAYVTQIAQMPKLPSVYSPEFLHSDPDMISGYSGAVMADSKYKTALFALRASSIATAGVVNHLKRVAASLKVEKDEEEKVAAVVENFRLAEQSRQVDHAYLFFEEVPAVQERIQAARSKRLGAIFGDELVEQMTKDEQAAARTDRLKGFELGSLTDRLLALDVRLPDDPDKPIPGVFQLSYASEVVVAGKRKPGEETPIIQDPNGGSLLKVVPVNAAGIAYYGGTYDQWVQLWALNTVTISQLQEKNIARASTVKP